MPANAGISSRHRKVPLSPARVRDDPLGDSCASTLNLRDNGITSAKEFAMRIKKLPVVLVSIFLLSVFSSAQVLKIVVDDTIQAATQERIERAIDQAATERDDAVLIELSTPGGLMDSMRQIMSKILASPVPVIIYVTPSGSRAASAGFFILRERRRCRDGAGNQYRSCASGRPFRRGHQGHTRSKNRR